MSNLTQFIIPFRGLKNKVHYFNFQVNDAFFEAFEYALIKNGTIAVQLEFDKQPSFFRLHFSYKGTVRTVCDRCTDRFDLPIEGTHHLIVRFSEQNQPDEEEIIFLKPSAIELEVAPLIYEIIHLGLPFRKVCEENEAGLPSCNSDIMDYLMEDDLSEAENLDSNNTVWSELKNFKIQ